MCRIPMAKRNSGWSPKIELALNQGLSQQQLNEALNLVHAHHTEIIDAWRAHFGG